MSQNKPRPRLWKRNEVETCDCEEYGATSGKKHVHCPCLSCGHKAVARTTEYRHYTQQKLLLDRYLNKA